MANQNPYPWKARLLTLTTHRACEVLKDFHAITVKEITDLPEGPVKAWATKNVLAPELFSRDKLGQELGHTATLDEKFMRAVGERVGKSSKSPMNPFAAAVLALEARWYLLMAPWENGDPWWSAASDGSIHENDRIGHWMNDARRARAEAAGVLEDLLHSQSMGKTYGQDPTPPRGDRPYQDPF